jgi:hypothetical protein
MIVGEIKIMLQMKQTCLLPMISVVLTSLHGIALAYFAPVGGYVGFTMASNVPRSTLSLYRAHAFHLHGQGIMTAVGASAGHSEARASKEGLVR